jgi:hypothetical protein
MTKNRETREVQDPCFLAVGGRDDCLIWRQQVGLFRAYDNPDRVLRAGMAGQSDSGMIVRVKITPEMVGQEVGIAVQPEFKAVNGRQSDKQKNWQAAVELAGGIYRLIRSVGDMDLLIDDVKNGRWKS